VAETDLRHIRVAYSTTGTSWTCYVQSNDDSQGDTPSFAAASSDCGEGPSHAKSGSVFNIPAPAQYISFAFWGWTDIFEVELTTCDGVAGALPLELQSRGHEAYYMFDGDANDATGRGVVSGGPTWVADRSKCIAYTHPVTP
jgi:hypothetical protein